MSQTQALMMGYEVTEVIDSFDLGISSTSDTIALPSNERAWCLERTTAFGYTGYLWQTDTTDDSLFRRFQWSGSAWTSTSTTVSHGMSGTPAGMADSGTYLCAVSTSGEFTRVAKSNYAVVTSTLDSSNNLQGLLWDGSNFYAGSFTYSTKVYKVNNPAGTNPSTTEYTLPSGGDTGVNRSATYNHDNQHYILGDSNDLDFYSGSNLSTFVKNVTASDSTSDEIDYFEQSDNTRWILVGDDGTLYVYNP